MTVYNNNPPVRSRIVNPWLSLLPAMLLSANAAFALDTGDIVVASTKGEVHFVISGAERAVRAGSALELPASIRTGRDGGVELRQGATTLSVGPDTLLEFPALAQKGGPIDRVVQPRGNVFYNVGKRPGRKLRVETPFLVGVVKGTQFNVAAQDNATTISLFEGLLEIRSADDSDVVDLHAGEIASRDRSAHEISVLKMDSKPAVAPKPSSGSGNGKGSGNGAPAPNPPRAPQNVEGAERFAARDSGERAPVETPATLQAEVAAPAGNNGAGVDIVASTPAVMDSPGVEVIASADSGSAAVDVVAAAPATSVDVAVETPAATADVSVDLVSTPAGGGASVDVAVETPVASAETNVDLGTSAGSGASVDVAVETPAVSADMNVDVGTPAGNGASVDLAVETPAGSANVDLGASANVDLGTAAVVTVDSSVDLGLDTDDDKGKNGNANGIGNGNGYGNGNANGNGNGNGVIDTVDTATREVVEDTADLVDKLLKKPGKK